MNAISQESQIFAFLSPQGETLPWPEKVPFRLTHNMVSAMGASGIEGQFLRACELTLSVIRQNMSTLFNVVRPIIFDVTRKHRLSEVKQSKEEFINKDVSAKIILWSRVTLQT
jgi:serine/threonine-protein kinase ATR